MVSNSCGMKMKAGKKDMDKMGKMDEKAGRAKKMAMKSKKKKK